jgi:thiosulfate dehydrogenase
MKFGTFAALFGVICAAIAIATLALRPPVSTPLSDDGPTSPPSSWPDYSVNGPGFITPDVPDGALIGYGYGLVTRTYALIGPEVFNPEMRFAGNNLACRNCHLDGGTKPSGLPLVGVYKTFPKFSLRSQRVISLPERVNECMTRSMNGRALPDDSREMAALVAYMRFIGDPPAVPWVPAEPAPLAGDVGRGGEVFATVCAACHQADGLGKPMGSINDARGYVFPPLWGPDSFNDAAGMDHDRNLVGFVRRNMPRGVDPQHPQLTLQQVWDVAAYVRSKPRPQFKPDTAGSRSP